MFKQANLQKVKVQMLATTSSYHDLVRVVSTQPEWAWANNPAIMENCKQACAELEAFKASSSFWKDWVVQQDFLKTV